MHVLRGKITFRFSWPIICCLFSQLSFPECEGRLISPCLADLIQGLGVQCAHKGTYSHPSASPCTLHTYHTHKQLEPIRKISTDKMVELVEKARWIRIVAIIQFVFICLCTIPILPLPSSYLFPSFATSSCCRMVTDLSALCNYCT